MKREIKKYLFDIKPLLILSMIILGGEKDFSTYQENKLLRRAIEREIEIIGEAMNRIMKLDPEIKIENDRQIIDTRNWVIHGYDKADNIVMWGIITIHLPKLKKEESIQIKLTYGFCLPGAVFS